MAGVRELRARARQGIGPALGICAVVYFAYHAVHGERGLIAWWRLEHEVKTTRKVAADVAARRRAWEARVRHLRPESLDPDMLDERVRTMLGYAGPNDLVVLTAPWALAEAPD